MIESKSTIHPRHKFGKKTMNAKVLLAVFKRNFVSYFANPTGYVFICLFVLLSSFAAFWPNEFFNTNLANLNQLSLYFPFIMLVFIPAITMSIWADERRQGTDELLLTIPASDFDVVLGKYLAAVAIFTVSLLFSFVCNFWVLGTLGSPDLGLFIGTYIGYWLVGLAMLAVGMVASFLTGNLTVAFILGALFNAPLVFLVKLDMPLKQWSFGEQFAVFGRGILSFSHLLFFATIVAAMLYLSIVFIGRRHWRAGASSLPRYVVSSVQVAALIVIGANLCLLAGRSNARVLRFDVTSERLSSLSADTVNLLKNLEIDHPVQIEAFISPEVPELYVQTHLDLLNMLQEIKAAGGKDVVLKINRTERFSDESARAEQRYGIRERRVFSRSRGTMAEDFIYMGVAFTCGLEKVILPFVDRGIPVEYELVRSISTITQQTRKRIGVLQTDAQLYGQFNMQAMSSSPDWPIIAELEKQYEVVKVDATNPLTEQYDALLAVQPSSLSPPQWDNFMAAVRAGQPTAVFEDPFPVFAPSVPATLAPRRAPGGMNPMMMQQQQPPQKTSPDQLAMLWRMLGVDFAPNEIIWQTYNPYPAARHFPAEFVFVDEGAGKDLQPFAEADSGPGAPISAGLQHMLFPFPGAISPLNASKMEFTALARTGENTGTVDFGEVMQMTMFGRPGGINPDRKQVPRNMSYIMAAYISGKAEAVHPPAPEGEDASAEDGAPKQSQINVVLVADIDLLSPDFFRLREQGSIPEAGVTFDFDNVTFVLNVLDQLAGDDRFIEIRKRRPKHRTLTKVEERTEEARKKTAATRDEIKRKQDESVEKAQQALKDEMAKLQEELQKQENVNLQAVLTQVATIQKTRQQRLDREIERQERERDEEIQRIDGDLIREIRQVQDGYKFWAVILPPIPPLMLAVLVFFIRRYKEREGVSRSRLRS